MKKFLYFFVPTLALLLVLAVGSYTQTSRQIDGGSGGGGGAVTAASGAFAAGSLAVGAAVDGALVTIGLKTDNKSTATDTTSASLIALMKQNNYLLNLLITGTATSSVTDPCLGLKTTGVDKYLASATPVKIISALASNKNNGCSGIVVPQGTAETISVIEGTGSNCGTGTAIVWGGDTTASHGFAFLANGGTNSIRFTGITANVDTCLRTSGSNPVTFHLEFVQAP